MPPPGCGFTSHTTFSASLSCTTTPIAAKTSVTVPMMEAKTPSLGAPAAVSMALTASDPLSPSRPRMAWVTSCCTPSRPKNRAASEMTTTISGPIEKIE